MRSPLDPVGFFRRIPLQPHQMTDRVTRTKDVIVLCHLGVPRLSTDDWSLSIDGLVETPIQIRFADLIGFPKVTIESIHQCAGSPLQPQAPTRRITNVVWSGARLSDLLATVGARPNTSHIWSSGADHGAFDGVACDSYVKDIPISRIGHDVLIAYELNGEPLPPEHGFPARLVVPGYYGTNSVKWLTRLTLAETRAPGPFTTRWYNDPVRDSNGQPTGHTRPVWSIAPESVITSPAPGQTVPLGQTVTVRGWAWADGGIAKVEISADGAATWSLGDLDASDGFGWQAFHYQWIPAVMGPAELVARATSSGDETQPLTGSRNAMHRVALTVV